MTDLWKINHGKFRSQHVDKSGLCMATVIYFSGLFSAILSYQELRLFNLTLGLTASIFSDWIFHKPKIVTINMINHKAVQKIDKHQASR